MKDSGKVYIASIVVLVLVGLIAAPKAQAQFTISVWTDRPVYNAGEPVRVSFETVGSGLPATVRIDVLGPISYTWGPVDITTGTVYTATLSGATMYPGFYQVKVTLGLTMDIYTGTTSYQVIQPTPFDFKLVVTPSTLTIKKGETAKFSVSRTVSDPYYEGVVVKITDVQGLGVGMSWKLTAGATATLSITTSESTPPGTYSLTIVGSAEGQTRTETVTLIVEALFDYSINVSPSTQTVNIGKTVTYTVTATLISGQPQLVSLSLTGLPADVSYTFSTPSGTPSFTSTLTLDASSASTTGTYTFTVTGSGAGMTRTGSSTLIMKEAQDFTLTASTSSLSFKQGEKTTLTVNIQPIEGFQSPVTLTATGLPNGVTCTFNPSSGIPPFSSTLTIEAASSTPEGDYTITITGSGEGKTHSTTVSISILKNPYSIAGLTSMLTNPMYLAVIIVVIAVAVSAIVLSKKKRLGTSRHEAPRAAFCPKCGKPIEPNSEYCGSCGATVK